MKTIKTNIKMTNQQRYENYLTELALLFMALKGKSNIFQSFC